MIYDVNDFDRIPAMEESGRPPKSFLSICKEWGCFGVAVILFLPLLTILLPVIFLGILLCKTFRFIRNDRKTTIADINLKEPEEEEESVFMEVGYDKKTETLKATMDYFSLQSFIQDVKENLIGHHGMYMRDFKKAYTSDEIGYHIHSRIGDWELLLGIDEGLFYLNGGDTLWASKDTWSRAIVLLEEVLEKREEKIILLDKYQTEWCKGDSIGRFQIHYKPEVVLDG